MSHLADAKRIIAAVRERTDAALVALSGGKDSLATLALCCGAFSRVEAYFLYLLPGLESAEGPVRYAARRFGVRLHTRPHYDLSRMLRYGVYSDARPDVRRVGLADVEAELRLTTGIGWIAYGYRADESLHRRGMMRQCGGVDVRGRRFFPLAQWSRKDVLAYLRRSKLQIPVSDRAFSSGIDLTDRTLTWLRENYPRDYERILEAFPYAGASEARARFYGQAPAVRDPADEPGGHQGRPVQPSTD